jgi:hypothetical protein
MIEDLDPSTAGEDQDGKHSRSLTRCLARRRAIRPIVAAIAKNATPRAAAAAEEDTAEQPASTEASSRGGAVHPMARSINRTSAGETARSMWTFGAKCVRVTRRMSAREKAGGAPPRSDFPAIPRAAAVDQRS